MVPLTCGNFKKKKKGHRNREWKSGCQGLVVGEIGQDWLTCIKRYIRSEKLMYNMVTIIDKHYYINLNVLTYT